MAKLSSDGKYATVEKGDTLWSIAEKYLGEGIKNKQLATINGISNPDFIVVGQKIYLTKDGSSVKAPVSKNVITNITFGELSTSENTLYATWYWGKADTAKYKVQWTYDTGDGVWFEGQTHEITIDEDDPSLSRQHTYSIPDNAVKVRFRVKPIAKTETDKKGKETAKWTASWSEAKYWTDATTLDTPSAPSIDVDKYTLTASLDNVDIPGAKEIEFEIVKNNRSTTAYRKRATIDANHASYQFKVDPGAEYKVRCRAYTTNSVYSEWSEYSSNAKTIPATPSGIATIRASSESSVYLAWDEVAAATKYDIEYATKKEHFDNTDETTTETGIEFTHFEFTGLESGSEYFFRLRAVNDEGESGWSEIKSIVIGTVPAAPTTWSSSTTVITGEPLILYWVHNTEDGSSQTYAELELYINDFKETHTLENNAPEDEKDKTSTYEIDTSEYLEGTKIQWRVRTAGVTLTYGDWSAQRTIDVYAPPTVDLRMTNIDEEPIETLTSFPFFVYALAGPNTQIPVGYHLAITSNDIYETVDNLGNPKTVNVGEELYSKYFDTHDTLLVEFSASNLDLENSISYTITCTVSMNSGLTAEASRNFTVAWQGTTYEPNAEISIDKNAFTASIRPYCEDVQVVYRKVEKNNRTYTVTDMVLDPIYGTRVNKAYTTTGELVYQGVTADGDEAYYCTVEERMPITDILLSVYRREFDGTFTELATNLDAAKNTTVTDPHPALDYARYRVVATTKDTGTVSYYDLPGYPVGGIAAVIQWDEVWSNFDVTEDAVMEQPPWAGSLLKLPYNIDVSDSNEPDVAKVEYIGRSHPIVYYGTQVGSTQTWNMVIEKDDEETLYALRRLARWMGDVYVREPSGSGYWAHVTVSFSQKHRDLTIPVSLKLTRVEGGV